MKMEINLNSSGSGVGNYRDITITHNNKKVNFASTFYNRTFVRGDYDPFKEINKYWNRLEPNDLDYLFGLYEQARDILNEPAKVSDLIISLRPIINEIIHFYGSESFDAFVRRRANIWIPDDLRTEYVYNHEKPGTREQTYLIDDYWNLVLYSLKARTVIPIIVEFIDVTKAESGSAYSTLNAYYLLTKSDLMNEPALEKLYEYVGMNAKQDEINIRSSLDGIGSEYFITSIIANIVTKVLCIAELGLGDDNSHLVQLVHKEIRNRLSQLGSYQNRVEEKKTASNTSDPDDSLSIIEGYKNKPLVATGEFSAIEIYTTRMHEILARLLVKVELDHDESESLKKEYEHALDYIDYPYEQCQIDLIKWIVNPIISPRCLLEINRASVVRLSVIAQEWLFLSGFKDISLLPTAKSLPSDEYGSSNGMFKINVSKQHMEELNQYYPYFKKFPNKKNFKQVNEVLVEIENLDKKLSNYTWSLGATDEKILSINSNSLNRIYRTPNNLKTRLVELAILLQKRNKEYVSLFKIGV